MDAHMDAQAQRGIIAGYAVPHPPLIVPTVGRGQEEGVRPTIDAYEEVARRIAKAHPEVVVVTSPHAPLFRDGFFISDAAEVHGNMSRFGAPSTTVSFSGDPALASALAEVVEAEGISVALESALADRLWALGEAEGIDHGTFVPLYFLGQETNAPRVLRIGLSGLSEEDHRAVGHAIERVLEEQGKRTVFVASGDLSHRLKADGPYGFDPAGPAFDEQIGQIFAKGELNELFAMDGQLCEDAAECGLRSFQIMAGALEEAAAQKGIGFESELLSLEGPFGVGYGVAAFEAPADPTKGARISKRDPQESEPLRARGSESIPVDEATNPEELGAVAPRTNVDPYVRLARESVEGYVTTGVPISRPEGLPPEMLARKAGAFVSLHEKGGLRGCIGTISATQDCIADEIIMNGISACSRDPRFPPVRPEELDFLDYSVDILGDAEPIAGPEELDPDRYGVIVTQGWKRGLLLPHLDGVDTVAQQVAIAKQKAGISPFDEDVELERFEVVRHTRGGEARA